MIPKDELNHTTLGLVTFKSNSPSAKDFVRISPIKKHICDRICEKDLPHTSNYMNLEDCIFHFKAHTNLKFSISTCINLCWYSLLPRNGCFQSEVINCQSWQIGCVWKTSFRKSSHIYSLLSQDPDILITPTAMVLYPQNLRFNITYSLGSIDDVSKVNMTFPIRVDVFQSPVSLLNIYLYNTTYLHVPYNVVQNIFYSKFSCVSHAHTQSHELVHKQ